MVDYLREAPLHFARMRFVQLSSTEEGLWEGSVLRGSARTRGTGRKRSSSSGSFLTDLSSFRSSQRTRLGLRTRSCSPDFGTHVHAVARDMRHQGPKNEAMRGVALAKEVKRLEVSSCRALRFSCYFANLVPGVSSRDWTLERSQRRIVQRRLFSLSLRLVERS